jgi:hypothetical protein
MVRTLALAATISAAVYGTSYAGVVSSPPLLQLLSLSPSPPPSLVAPSLLELLISAELISAEVVVCL